MVRLFDVLIRFPRTSLLVMLVVTLFITAGAFRLQIDFSPEQVYVGQDEAVDFAEAHKRQFRFEDSILLVLLEATDPEGTLLREDCLRWMKSFAGRTEKLDGVLSVTSVVTLERPRVSARSSGEVTWIPLFPEDLYADTELLASRLKQMPLLNDTLVSEDHQLMMTLIDLDPEGRNIDHATQRMVDVENTLADMPLPPETRVFISGVPAIRVDVIRSIRSDQWRMVPLCSSLFLLVSLMIFRSAVVTFLSLAAVLSSVGWTMGIMGWCGSTFSIMSNVIPTLILIIGAANNVHILSRFQVEVRLSDCDTATAARRTMREMSRTCFLTLATTGIGFGSLLVAKADLLQALAIQAALGTACCYVCLMLVVTPSLMICGDRLCPWRRRSPKGMSPAGSFDDSSLSAASEQTVMFDGADGNSDEQPPTGLHRSDFWRKLGEWICRNAKTVVALHLLLGTGTLWWCRDMAINSYIFETYDGDHPTMEAVRIMNRKMSGLTSLEVQLRAENGDRFFDADVAEGLARVRREISNDSRVSFYRDYVEFLAAFDHGRPLASDTATVEASLRRVRLVMKKLNRPEMVTAFLGLDVPVARVMMRVQDIGSARMKEMFVGIEASLKRNLPSDIQFTLTGDAYLHAVCMDEFVRDLFYSLLTASGIIFTLITLLFRSLRIGLISVFPNMLPLIMTLGYMHLSGYELTAGNVIVFAISLGIAVDDTIHFLSRYRDERRSSGREDAVVETLASSGRAIVLTSILVVSGLSILIFSDFVPTRRFAELTAVTMCTALAGDIILLPALLHLWGTRRRTVAGSSQTAPEIEAPTTGDEVSE